MDDDNVRMIADGGVPGSLTDAEVAMMQFARRIARDASRITSGEVDALKKIHGFTDAEVVDGTSHLPCPAPAESLARCAADR